LLRAFMVRLFFNGAMTTDLVLGTHRTPTHTVDLDAQVQAQAAAK
jgi:hypothetical protein